MSARPSLRQRLKPDVIRAALAYRAVLVLLRVVRPVRSTVVYSPSVGEGNALEVLRGLARAGRTRSTWIVDAPPADDVVTVLFQKAPERRPRVLPRRSLRAVWAYARADLVLFTHQLYGCPRSGAGRFFVNLWHGDGPKAPVRDTAVRGLPSDLLVSGTAAWGRERARVFKVPEDSVVITGNPRVDQLWAGAGDASLRRLGLDPSRPFLLWAPTFRTARVSRSLGWSDSASSGVFDHAWREDPALVERLEATSVQLVVKPHPFDAQAFGLPGVQVLTDADLLREGVVFYELLGRAAGLVTDYSSVWSDFLPIDRPIGFFCPDLDDYRAGRGFGAVPFEETLPGPLLRTTTELTSFAAAVGRGEDPTRGRRAAVAGQLGVELRPGATDRLLTLVEARAGMHLR